MQLCCSMLGFAPDHPGVVFPHHDQLLTQGIDHSATRLGFAGQCNGLAHMPAVRQHEEAA